MQTSLAFVVGVVVTTGMLAAPDAYNLSQTRQPASTAKPLAVSSAVFKAGGRIPEIYSEYGEGISPGLMWSEGPSGTRSFALLMEDPDAPEPKPFVHWIFYNLPAETRQLPESVPPMPRLPEFGGALQGKNSRGATGYYGPKPPVEDPAHNYRFEIYALDTILPLDPNADRARLLEAMRGHVLSSGALIGKYQAPRTP